MSTIATRTLSPAPAPAPTRRRGWSIALWALQAVLAVQFAIGGLLKLTGNAEMVTLFTDVGAGQWLRYGVGALELAAAIGLLIPVLCGLAALGVTCLMVGAAITNVAVLDQSPALPLGFLVVAALIAWCRRARTAELVRRFAR